MKRKNRAIDGAPETPATKFLRKHGVAFTAHPYEYEAHGGTRVSAEKLGVPEHVVVKTLVMENERGEPLIVLMHGDRKVSTKALARQIGCKSINQCAPETANRHSGFLVGGTSPFGTRKALPVFVEKSVLALDTIYINGGRRGLLVSISPAILEPTLGAKVVECAIAA
ncbi:MAG: aminoacyl-tRNA deacylase [Rhodocyclaceae bacterium]|nr:aminoacyl-tRNA deacylase [Rhodocyclaceae bacterium]